ncbi:MAG: uracil-DNA glycosylase [Hyphomicrobium sp.]|jgi:DNA polymerase
MQPESESLTLAALLDWYRAMGADAAVAEEATNWLERGEASPGQGFTLISSPSSTPAPRESPEVSRARAPAAAPAKATTPLRGSEPAPGARPADPRFDPVREAARPAPQHEATRQASASPESRQFKTAAPDAAELSARTLARNATSLPELEKALQAFDGCGLKATAKNLCFYRGAERARLMIVGEAPGRDEDLEGKPFVGPAGQLLNKMLAAISLTEADVHITNVVYWRPPGNRTPTPQEAQVCRPFLERQVELVEPEAIVLLGGAAAKQILDVADGIMRIRGKWREAEIGTRRFKAMATLHPAYLLRTPAAKRLAWRDLQAIRAALGH